MAGVSGYLKQHWLGYAVGSLGVILYLIYVVDEYLQYRERLLEHFGSVVIPHILIFLTPLLFFAAGWLVDRKAMLERKARKSEEKFRDLFENAYDIIFTLDLEGNILSANSAAIKISGYDAGEIYTLNIAQLLPADLLQDARMRIARIAAGETQPPLEYEFIKKDGSRAIIELTSRAITEKGKPVGIHCIAREITERKLAEMEVREANEKLNSMIKTSPYAIIGVDTSNRVEIWNPAAEKLFGWSKFEVLGRVLPTVPVSHKQHFQKNMEALVSGRSLLDVESVAQKKDGSIINTRISAAPIYDTRGELTSLISFISDITGRKQMEQKIADSERYLKNIIESSADSIIALDARGNIVLFNDGAEKLFGYRKEEVIGKNIIEDGRALFYGEIKEARRVMRAMRESKDGRITNLEVLGKNKDGKDIYTSISASLLKNEKGEIIGTLGIAKDINQQKLAEEALKASEEKYRSLVESTDDSIYVVDRDLRFLLANNKYLSRLYKFNPASDKIEGKAYSDFYSPVEVKEFAKKVKTVFETAGSVSYEHRSRKDGSYFFRTLSPVIIEGKVNAVTVISKDITDLKRVDEELRKHREQLEELVEVRTAELRVLNEQLQSDIAERGRVEEELNIKVALLDAANDSIFLRDFEGNFLYVNEAAYKSRGYTREEFMKLGVRDLDTPENYRILESRTKKIIEEGEAIFETAHFRKDRSIMPVEVHARLVEFGGRKLVLSVVRDISERKRVDEELRKHREQLEELVEVRTAELRVLNEQLQRDIAERMQVEEALRASEEKYRSLVESTDDSIYVVDRDLRFLLANNKYLSRVIKFKLTDQPVGRYYGEFYSAEETREFAEKVNTVFETASSLSHEHRSNRDGRYFLRTLSPVVIGDRVSAVTVISKDINERKQAEEALRVTNEKLKAVITSSPLAIISCDPCGKIEMWNPAAECIFGWREKEVLGLFNPTVPEDKIDEYRGYLDRVMLGEAITSSEVRARRRNGSPIDLSVSAAPLYDATGKVSGIMSVIADITDRKQIEEALIESEERYRTLFENSPISLWEEDFSDVKKYIDGLRASGVGDFSAYFKNHPEAVRHCADLVKVVDVNKVSLEIYEASSKEELMRGLGNFIGDASFEVFREELIAVARGIGRFECEATALTLKGNSRQIALSFSVPAGYRETLSRRIVSIIDITERKRVEQALRESEAKYRELADSITDIFFAVNYDLKITYWNEASEMLTGVRTKNAIGKSILGVFPGLGGASAEIMYREVLRTKQPKIFVNEFNYGVKKFFFEITAYPSEHGLSVFVKDITDRKQIEEALIESEERYRTLFENSPTSIRVDDFSDVKKYIDGLRASGVSDFKAYFEKHPEAVRECAKRVRVVDVNKATLELYQAESKAELLQGLEQVFVKESFDVFKEEIIGFAEGKTRYEGEAINQTLKGDLKHIVLRASVAPGCEPTMSRVISLIVDITERKKLEQKLQNTYAELKEQYDRKMDFTNMAAHELRTPLVPIVGYLSMLKEAIQDERLLRYIEVMERNAMRQSRLIDRMLELSRLDAGKVELEYSDVNVQELLQWIIYDYAPSGRKFFVDAPVNLVIRADEDKLFQILDNLISNAVKYSPSNTEIKICVEERGEDYLFKVIDQGTGIKREDQKRIFERFYIVGGNKTARESRRTGLGLALAKSYVELHGGDIWVKSEPGKGSTFYFMIPMVGC